MYSVDQEIDAVLAAEFVDGGDVGVVQARQGQSFGAKAFSGGFVGQGSAGQHLDGDVAVQLQSCARYTTPIPPAPILSTSR